MKKVKIVITDNREKYEWKKRLYGYKWLTLRLRAKNTQSPNDQRE